MGVIIFLVIIIATFYIAGSQTEVFTGGFIIFIGVYLAFKVGGALV